MTVNHNKNTYSCVFNTLCCISDYNCILTWHDIRQTNMLWCNVTIFYVNLVLWRHPKKCDLNVRRCYVPVLFSAQHPFVTSVGDVLTFVFIYFLYKLLFLHFGRPNVLCCYAARRSATKCCPVGIFCIDLVFKCSWSKYGRDVLLS